MNKSVMQQVGVKFHICNIVAQKIYYIYIYIKVCLLCFSVLIHWSLLSVKELLLDAHEN